MRMIALRISGVLAAAVSAFPAAVPAQDQDQSSPPAESPTAAGPARIELPELRMAPEGSERDIIVTDVDGHLILRFAGTEPGMLDRNAIDEIAGLLGAVDVPDDLAADLRFEAERVDADWASETARGIRRYILDHGPGYIEIHVECRSTACRVHLYEARRLNVLEHQRELSLAEPVIAAFIADHAPEFQPLFLMAAYTQGLETPFIRVILTRTRQRGASVDRAAPVPGLVTVAVGIVARKGQGEAELACPLFEPGKGVG